MLSVNAAVTDLPFYMIFFLVVVGREVQCSWLWVCKAEIIIYCKWGIIFIHFITGGQGILWIPPGVVFVSSWSPTYCRFQASGTNSGALRQRQPC